MSKANQKARTEGTELEDIERNQLQQRYQLVQMKTQDVGRAQMELQMLQGSTQTFINELLLKYELDMTKQYTFNGKALVEVKPPEVKKEE